MEDDSVAEEFFDLFSDEQPDYHSTVLDHPYAMAIISNPEKQQKLGDCVPMTQ